MKPEPNRIRISKPGPCTRALTTLFVAGAIVGSVHAGPENAVPSLHDSKSEPAGALHPEAPPSSEAIPWSEIGTKAAEQYQGDGLSVAKTDEGAILRCIFQKLEGEATPEGLWLKSTAGEAGVERFRVMAREFGREHALQSLEETGPVKVAGELVQWQRPGLVEEYLVTVDGVRQDFVIAKRPPGEGPLRVDLEVTGAKAEVAGHGARLVVEGSGRRIAYSRLRVIDAEGRELAARIEVATSERIVVVVDDNGAAYPVRVDPTFSDENWISLNPGIPGTNRSVLTAVVDSLGNLYVGGIFTFVGDIEANFIAKWDGTSWSALGAGMDSHVFALAVSGDALYAGGNFTTAGGKVSPFVAKAILPTNSPPIDYVFGYDFNDGTEIRGSLTASMGPDGFLTDIANVTVYLDGSLWVTNPTVYGPSPDLYPRIPSDGSVTGLQWGFEFDIPFDGVYESFFNWIDPALGFDRAVYHYQGPSGTGSSTDTPQNGSWFLTPAPNQNEPPLADAGTDLIIECATPFGTPVTLDGSASHDPDPEFLLEWAELHGLPEGVQAATARLARTLAATDPRAGAELALEVAPSMARTQALTYSLDRWAAHDLDAVIAWAQQSRDPGAKELGLLAAADAWARHDSAGALAWIASWESDPAALAVQETAVARATLASEEQASSRPGGRSR